jgi:hypothetical protein
MSPLTVWIMSLVTLTWFFGIVGLTIWSIERKK